MSHSFTQINIHIIFATKNRAAWLEKTLRRRVFAYMAQTARKTGGASVIVNGYADHAHVLLDLDPTMALATIVRDIKSNSSRWIRRELGIRDFAWQSGYAAFSVSGSLVNKVRRYIENQEAHHRRVDYLDELKVWLAKHGVKVYETLLD